MLLSVTNDCWGGLTNNWGKGLRQLLLSRQERTAGGDAPDDYGGDNGGDVCALNLRLMTPPERAPGRVG